MFSFFSFGGLTHAGTMDQGRDPKTYELGGNDPYRKMAEDLGRNSSAVVMKAYKLKLSLKMKLSDSRSPSYDPGAAGMNLTGRVPGWLV